MKIDILCNDGSPLGVTLKDIRGANGRVGVGGAELALLTMCEGWADRGDEVRLYNDPKGDIEKFAQLPISAFEPHANRDVLIIFRSPNYRAVKANGKRVWWSCDQYTTGSFQDFAPVAHNIVVISDFHKKYFKDMYGISNTKVVDLPVRIWEYEENQVERVPNQIIFCSVPDRGLKQMAEVWARIHEQMPEASLVITSDYRLWGAEWAMNEQYIFQFMNKNASVMGAIPRHELVKYQLSSDLMVYPCIYDELFCISVAECSVAGAIPLTSTSGALETTNMGYTYPGNPLDIGWQRALADASVTMLKNRENLELDRAALVRGAKRRFDISKILLEWDKVFEL